MIFWEEKNVIVLRGKKLCDQKTSVIVLGGKNLFGCLGGKSLCDCSGRKKPLLLFWEENKIFCE